MLCIVKFRGRGTLEDGLLCLVFHSCRFSTTTCPSAQRCDSRMYIYSLLRGIHPALTVGESLGSIGVIFLPIQYLSRNVGLGIVRSGFKIRLRFYFQQRTDYRTKHVVALLGYVYCSLEKNKLTSPIITGISFTGTLCLAELIRTQQRQTAEAHIQRFFPAFHQFFYTDSSRVHCNADTRIRQQKHVTSV